jgi:hypothetical protein
MRYWLSRTTTDHRNRPLLQEHELSSGTASTERTGFSFTVFIFPRLFDFSALSDTGTARLDAFIAIFEKEQGKSQ